MRVFHSKEALDQEGQEGGSPAYMARLEESLQLVKERGVTGTARHVVAALLKRLEETRGIKGPSEAGSSLQITAAEGDAWGRLVTHPAGELLSSGFRGAMGLQASGLVSSG